eukprot:11895000-Ditylum_brightwellii.AAC.1
MAVVEVNQKDSTDKSDIDEGLGRDSAKASICGSLNESWSNCHLQPQEQEKMTEEQGDNDVSE